VPASPATGLHDRCPRDLVDMGGPANSAISHIVIQDHAADWKMWTLQWEYTHLIYFGLQLLALASLLRSVRLETPGILSSAFCRQTGLVLWHFVVRRDWYFGHFVVRHFVVRRDWYFGKTSLLRIECEFTLSSIYNEFFVGAILL
jgi:hypothetical protein